MLPTEIPLDEIGGDSHYNNCTGPLQDPVNKQHQRVKLACTHFERVRPQMILSKYLARRISFVKELQAGYIKLM